MAKSLKNDKIDKVLIRMYCIGTGDCFVLKFLSGDKEKFTMMIDCGSCTGDKAHFEPYVQDLADYVGKEVDLLVVTHEHQDHVNGFQKCKDIFDTIKFREAWFAWTEHPEDPGGKAKELQKKRKEMRIAFNNAFTEYKNRFQALEANPDNSFFRNAILENKRAYVEGLNTLAEINLPASGEVGNSLAGMVAIKEKLETKDKIRPKYLKPGEIKTNKNLPGVKFYVLGPPFDRSYIFKDGKTGKDVFNKNILFQNHNFSETALSNSYGSITKTEMPFPIEYVITPEDCDSMAYPETSMVYQQVINTYQESKHEWRKIDDDWLNSVGTLAIRLNSHINNTSLALAIEVGEDRKILLFPGDAEFGSWDSWHAIEKWKEKGEKKKHLAEDILNRTVFYKVGHHLSYNGTALEKGIRMMNSPELAAIATLDRKRISSKWKSTMPNKFLLEELVNRCQGKVFIMNEAEIKNKPSDLLDPVSLGEDVYEESELEDGSGMLYKQYVVQV